MTLTAIISGGTIEFLHKHPPRGAHKTYAPWLDRKLEKVTAIELGEQTYDGLVGALFCQGYNVLRERRRDNKLVAEIGGFVFAKRAREGDAE